MLAVKQWGWRELGGGWSGGGGAIMLGGGEMCALSVRVCMCAFECGLSSRWCVIEFPRQVGEVTGF